VNDNIWGDIKMKKSLDVNSEKTRIQIYIERVHSGYFTNNPMPNKPLSLDVFVSKLMKTENDGTKIGEAIEHHKEKIAEYKNSMTLYRKRERELETEFKMETINYFGLTGHPKGENVFNYAWKEGHSNGYYEVIRIIEDIIDYGVIDIN